MIQLHPIETGLGVYTTTTDLVQDTRFLCVAPLSYRKVNEVITLQEAFDACAFCFIKKLPGDIKAFATQIRQRDFVTRGRMQKRSIVWVDDPDQFVDDRKLPPTFALTFNPSEQIFPYPDENQPQLFPFVSTQVSIQKFCKVELNEAENGLKITPPSSQPQFLTLIQSENSSIQFKVLIPSINLPLTPELEGIMQFDLSLGEEVVDDLDIGLRYFWQEKSNASMYSGRYPLFDLRNGDELLLQANLDPLRLDNSDRTFYSFKENIPLASHFRTILNRPIELIPVSPTSNQTPPKLRFTPISPEFSPTGTPFYLCPEGDFGISIKDIPVSVEETYTRRWACGLTGTEYINVINGEPGRERSLFRFIWGKPALSKFEQIADSKYKFDPLEGQQITSWMRVVPISMREEIQYFSEPSDSAFFQHKNENTSQRVLDYLAFTQSTLPAIIPDNSQIDSFPAVPYGDFRKPEQTGSLAVNDLAQAFEYQLLNPQRKIIINQMAALGGRSTRNLQVTSFNASQEIDGTALTPQGYVSKFEQGAWKQIRFAQVGSDQDISFEPGENQAELSESIQDAFLTNQQFLVISVANDHLGKITERVVLDGWSFDIKPPTSDQQSIGDYRNVIIFKSSKGTLSSLVKTPSSWAQYDQFNDVALDPQGLFLSQWLSDYIDQAKTLFNGGNTAYENFCQLVDDPGWNGFLVLRLEIPPELPDEIQAITAGIDTDRFFAHHLGNEVTQAEPDDQDPLGYKQKSALFALIDYKDPILERALNSNTEVSPFQQTTLDYDFKVLSLLATFENAELKTFSSKLMLIMNKWFGSPTIKGSPKDEEPTTNRLLLNGSVQQQDGEDVYVFATPKGTTSKFLIDDTALATIYVDRAEFNFLSEKEEGDVNKVKTAFSFWGALGFSQGPPLSLQDETPFDLFSYQSITFSDLSLNMDFDLKEVNEQSEVENRVFLFNTRQFHLKSQAVKVVEGDERISDRGFSYARKGSLVSQFPLKLKSFQQGEIVNGGPSSLNYGSLKTPPLKKAGLASDLKGAKDWYGLEYVLDLGGMGELAQNLVFTANLLFAWQPLSGNWYVGMKLPGLGPLDKLLDIQGVIKFGAQDISLNIVKTKSTSTQNGILTENEKMQYVLKFSSIGLSILSLTFPPKGSTNVIVFGDPSLENTPPTQLGWFGSYVKPGLKPSNNTPQTT